VTPAFSLFNFRPAELLHLLPFAGLYFHRFNKSITIALKKA